MGGAEAPGTRGHAQLGSVQAKLSADWGYTLLLAEALVLEPGAAWARGQADQEHRQGHQGREDASRPRNERLLDPGPPRHAALVGEAPGLVKVALPVNIWLGHRVGPGDAQATGPSWGREPGHRVGTSGRQRPTALGLLTLLSFIFCITCHVLLHLHF